MTDPEGSQPEVSAGQRQWRGSNRNQPDSTGSQEPRAKTRAKPISDHGRRIAMTNASRGEFIPDPHVASASSRDRRMFLRLLVGRSKGPSKRMGAGGGTVSSDTVATTGLRLPKRPGPGRQRRSFSETSIVSHTPRPPAGIFPGRGKRDAHPGRSLRPGSLP